MHFTPLKADSCDGSSCIETYLVKFETVAPYNQWSVADKTTHLETALVGPAQVLLLDAETLPVDDLVGKLKRRFGSIEQQERFRIELKLRRRRPNETLQELAHDIERLTALA